MLIPSFWIRYFSISNILKYSVSLTHSTSYSTFKKYDIGLLEQQRCYLSKLKIVIQTRSLYYICRWSQQYMCVKTYAQRGQWRWEIWMQNDRVSKKKGDWTKTSLHIRHTRCFSEMRHSFCNPNFFSATILLLMFALR